jgi:predicted dehydrogenase
MIPKIGVNEPLKNQALYFLDCIANNKPPIIADAKQAYEVVRTLAAISESINRKGEIIKL